MLKVLFDVLDDLLFDLGQCLCIGFVTLDISASASSGEDIKSRNDRSHIELLEVSHEVSCDSLE